MLPFGGFRGARKVITVEKIEEDMVRTRELAMKGLNLCELRKSERGLEPNCLNRLRKKWRQGGIETQLSRACNLLPEIH